MFDDRNTETDLLFKSILENGQEEVPARVWDGVASGLDRIARRKRAAFWLIRAAIGATAAAAAVIIGILLCHSAPESECPVKQIIAIAEPDTVIIEETKTETLAETVRKLKYTAYVPAVRPADTSKEAPVERLTDTEDLNVTTATSTVEQGMGQKVPVAEKNEPERYDWEAEEGDQKRKVRASLVVSGITGNNTGQKEKTGIMRQPVSSSAPPKTGIKEIGNDNRFGIPVSFGVGAKIDLTERWAVGAGVNYSLLTRRFSGEYMKVENGTIVEDVYSDIRNLQHYIGIPVNVYYNIVAKEKLNVYTYAGGAVEKCIANEYQVLESSITHKTKVQGVQMSANLGIGVEFMLNEHIGLYADPSARYYFNNRQPKSIRTSQPLMIGVEVGLRTRF